MLERRKIFFKNKLFEIYKEESIYISVFILLTLLPLIIGKPQLVVGVIVNSLLIYSTLRFGFKNTFPFLILPSSMSYFRGLLFGSVTIFLVYLIPFIIISNMIYTFTVSKLKENIFGIVLGGVLKAGFLYLVVNILMRVVSLPEIFLTTMGINQLITGLVGGVIGYSMFKYVKL